MPQSVRNGTVTLRWEEVMQTVPRMADLFKEFLLKIASSQLKRLHSHGERRQWLDYDAKPRSRI